MPLFDRVAYHISQTISEHLRLELGRILDANGATEVPLDRATHVVSNTIEFEGAITLKKEVACVTPYWVERSMELGILQDPKFFSADRELIFSGVVATSAGIPPGDKEVIVAGIKESGGQWREGLTRDVTHLFVTNTSSEKYQTAMHFRDSAHIIILLPQWFDQCWSMQMRLPHDVFEFPDPAYMQRNHDTAAYRAQMLVNKSSPNGRAKHAMFRTISQANASSSPAHGPAARDIWQGRAILLSSSLALDERRRESVETRIQRTGGTVVTAAGEGEDETAAVERADVLVTQYRTGPAYARALADGKMIGTLAWLFCVERSGVVSSPRDQLLHYPVRNRPIDGFAGHVITVTNYQGEERDYIKKLIDIMGAKFTPTMSGLNTIVIAAYKSGNKTEKADEWSVPIVTHKWLEDCFVEWRNLTPAQKKYLDYAPGVNYGTMLGDRGIGRIGLEEDPELPPMAEKPAQRATGASAREDAGGSNLGAGKAGKADSDEQHQKSGKKIDSAEGLPATATSAREAREVEEVEDALDLGGEAEYADDDPSPALGHDLSGESVVTPRKVGPPRGVKKTPASSDATGPPARTTSPPKSKPVSSGTAADTRERDEDALPSRKGKEKEKVTSKPVSEHDDSDEDQPSAKPKRSPRTTGKGAPGKDSAPAKSPMTSRAKSTSRISEKVAFESEEESGTGEEKLDVIRTKPSPRKARPTQVNVYSDEEDAPRPKAKPKPKPRPVKARAPTPDFIDEESSGADQAPPHVASKPSPKKYQSKARTKTHVAAPVSEPESEESAPPTKGGSPGKKTGAVRSKHGSIPSPTRIVSVELPDPRSLLSSVRSRARTPERRDSATRSKSTSSPAKSSPTRPKTLPRTSSIRAAAYEAPSVEPPKRGRPAVRYDTDEPHLPSSSPRRSGAAKAKAKAVSSSSRSSPTPPPIQRTPSRRSAAAAASQKLRDEVMPDVMNYENERKRGVRNVGRRRRTSSTAGVDDNEGEDSESEDDARAKKKRKVAPSGKRKTKASTREEDEEDRRTVKFVTHVRPTKRSAPSEDEDELVSSRRNSQSGSRKKFHMEESVSDDGDGDDTTPRKSSCDPKKIRILKTKVEVREDVCKALVKLGVRFTEKPAQCTHLVASSFARTEKFLCALSNAPFVLSMSWLLESSDKKMILAERDYLLKDPAMENKHNFKLTEALERARELKKRGEKLLQGHFFYFTANVPVDFGLMKNVIQANGAECIQKTPTPRNLSSTRHVVSCPQDEKLWRPLAKQGYAIYSPELILMTACAQFVDWDGESKRVQGSV